MAAAAAAAAAGGGERSFEAFHFAVLAVVEEALDNALLPPQSLSRLKGARHYITF